MLPFATASSFSISNRDVQQVQSRNALPMLINFSDSTAIESDLGSFGRGKFYDAHRFPSTWADRVPASPMSRLSSARGAIVSDGDLP